MKFKFFHQFDAFDCGPACLKMVSHYYGKKYSIEFFRNICYLSKTGVNLLNISEAAERVGFKTLKTELNIDILVECDAFPCILHWNKEHFIVLYKIKKLFGKRIFYLADPSFGLRKLSEKDFATAWLNPSNKGFAIFLEPTNDFYSFKEKDEEENVGVSKAKRSGFKIIYSYIKKYKLSFFQLLCGILLSSIFSVLFPFLTQNIVDSGIKYKDQSLILLILIAQLLLFFGNVSVDFIKSNLILHIGTRINVSLISDFLTKLMKLPIRFFESKNVGDLLQRIDDHRRIEGFLTGTLLNTLFSVINLIVLSIVLSIYNSIIFFIFCTGSILTVGWILFFLEQKKNADYRLFTLLSRNTNNQMEIINGMQEIKINNFGMYQKWKWEKGQAKLFNVSVHNLTLDQYQSIGSGFLNQLKNILVTFYSASLVINGQITLGMLLSISFIIGQLNNPIEQLINFIKMGQTAKISLDRIEEIHNQENEDDLAISSKEIKIISNEINRGITIKNIFFQYDGPKSPYVFENLSLFIPEGKITAIVGVSGSGKTTLLKLLLNFYSPSSGSILINNTDLKSISPSYWRKQCGVVLQDGYIFSDTILQNIVMGDENIDFNKLQKAISTASIEQFVQDLPLSINTKIGPEGVGLSTGQKQRILIARAIYKNPSYLFFDEATSSLDANNERSIVDNLKEAFLDKTVLVIAHRLSTVKNADQIVVLNKGSIVEIGNHSELSLNPDGYYYNLIKNQLEIGI